NGVATFSALSLDKTGTGYRLLAAANGLVSVASNPFNVTPAPATQLAFTAQPAGAVAGTTLGTVQVTARDQFGNRDVNFTGSVTVALTSGTGGAGLRGNPTAAAIAGLATFSGLSVDSAGTGYRLAAGSGSLTPGQSAAFAVTAGAATHVV